MWGSSQNKATLSKESLNITNSSSILVLPAFHKQGEKDVMYIFSYFLQKEESRFQLFTTKIFRNVTMHIKCAIKNKLKELFNINWMLHLLRSICTVEGVFKNGPRLVKSFLA